MRTNTSSICFNVRQLGVHSHSSDGFAARSLRHVIRLYHRGNIGACLAVGAVVCGRSLRLVHRVISGTGATEISTVVTTSITIVRCTVRRNIRIRLDARLGVSGIRTLHFCTRFTSIIILTHRLGVRRITRVRHTVISRGVHNHGNRLVHVRVFYRNTLYVTMSNGYCLSLRRLGTSTGHNTYVRIYHHTCRIFSRSSSVRLAISGGCVVSPGSLGAVRFVGIVVSSNIHIFGVRNHTHNPRCIGTIIDYCHRTVRTRLSKAFASRGVTS